MINYKITIFLSLSENSGYKKLDEMNSKGVTNTSVEKQFIMILSPLAEQKRKSQNHETG